MRILQVLIFALPWVCLPNVSNPYLEPKELALMSGLWALVLTAWFQRPMHPSEPRTPWLGYLASYILAVGLYHFQWQYGLRTPQQSQVVYNVYTWLPTVQVVVALMAVRALSNSYFLTPVTVQMTTQWWCMSAALTAGYALLQALGLDQWYVQPEPKAARVWTNLTGSFGNPEYLALYLAMLLPLFLLFRAKRYLVYASLLMAVLAIVRIPGVWIVAGVGLGSYAATRWWHATPLARLALYAGLVGSLVGAVIWLPHLMHGDERWLLWSQAWALVQAHDIIGVPHQMASFTGRGLGAIALLWAKSPAMWVHNEWLQALVEIGAVGVGLLATVVWRTTRHAWQRAQRSLVDAGWFGVWMAWLASTIIFPSAHWAHTVWVGLCAWGILDREDGYAEVG